MVASTRLDRDQTNHSAHYEAPAPASRSGQPLRLIHRHDAGIRLRRIARVAVGLSTVWLPRFNGENVCIAGKVCAKCIPPAWAAIYLIYPLCPRVGYIS